jgi:Skp family chaperone for outer membrane proteins
MIFAKSLFILVSIVVLTGITYGQVPTQTAPAKVGIINSNMFSSANGGITRLVNALRTLENEFKPRRDEITTLVARFNTLQQQPAAGTTQAQLQTRREQAETLQIDITRKQEDARTAYAKRLADLTNPIRLSVFNALEAYAKQRGIDVLLDVSKFPDGILLVNQSSDLTVGFIRDFNSKNP